MTTPTNEDGRTKAELLLLKEIHRDVVDKHRSIVRESMRDIRKLDWELRFFPKKFTKERAPVVRQKKFQRKARGECQ